MANTLIRAVAWAVLVGALDAPAVARGQAVSNGSNYWGPWPDKADPVVDGRKVSENLLTRPLPWERAGIDYREICTAYGSLRFAAEIGDRPLMDKIAQRYDVILTDRGRTLIPRPNHVDNCVFGILPLEIYKLTGNDAEKAEALEAFKKAPPATAEAPDARGRGAAGPRGTGRGAAAIAAAQQEAEAQWAAMKLSHQDQITRWLSLGLGHADAQWASPRADGLTTQTRMWVDDMFMITAIECQAFRVTGDPKYLDRAAREMVVYLDQLQQPNGLFFHASDSQFYWGRGNGWFAVGMAELLSDLPASHPQRARILEGYKKMMAGLLKYQATSGMWRQLIDHPDAWEETSGTGMFTFAMAVGVRQGWLDEATYKESARKAWIALSSHIDAQGQVTDVCVGTNKAAQSAPPGQSYLDYYLQRPHDQPGDYHGQAGYIWAAWAMIHEPEKK